MKQQSKMSVFPMLTNIEVCQRAKKKICSCVCTVIYYGSEMCFEPCYFYFIKKILENRYFYKNKRRAGAYFCAKIIPLFDILCHVIAWFTTSSNSGKKFSPYFSQCLNNQQFLINHRLFKLFIIIIL